MCTFRVAGKRFNPDAFHRESLPKPASIRRRGKPFSPGGRPSSVSNINFAVSNASWTNFKRQVRDAQRFIQAHTKDLERLSKFPGVEIMSFDFPIEVSKAVWNGETYLPLRFPIALVRKAAKIGLELEISVYTGNTSG